MSIDDVIRILTEFEGIIGALLGAIGTLICTHILKNKGKCIVNIKSDEVKCNSIDDWGTETIKPIEDADNLSIKFELELYNTSEIPKYLKDFKLCIKDINNKDLALLDLYDSSTGRWASASEIYDYIDYINVMPKLFQKKELHCTVHLDENEQVRKMNNLYLNYIDSNNKMKSIKIK